MANWQLPTLTDAASRGARKDGEGRKPAFEQRKQYRQVNLLNDDDQLETEVGGTCFPCHSLTLIPAATVEQTNLRSTSSSCELCLHASKEYVVRKGCV